MKKSIFVLTVVAALVMGLALTGCPSTTEEEITIVRPATNTQLSVPRDVDLKVGSAGWDFHNILGDRITVSQAGTSPTNGANFPAKYPVNASTTYVAFSFQASTSEDDYDVTYRFYVRQKDSTTFYEIIDDDRKTNPLSFIYVPQFFPQAGNANVFYPSALYPELFTAYNSTPDTALGTGITPNDRHPLTKGTTKLFNGIWIPSVTTWANGDPINPQSYRSDNIGGPIAGRGNVYPNTLLNSYPAASDEILNVERDATTYYNPRTTDAGVGTYYYNMPARDGPQSNIDEGANQNAYPREGVYVFFQKPQYVRATQDGNRTVLRLVANAPLDADNLPRISTTLPRREFTYAIIIDERNLVGQQGIQEGIDKGTMPFDLTPFATGEEYQFGVQTILNADQYAQQTIKMDPSPIVWAANYWTRP